jgi:diadenosine tetraphosphate (Ap4A) HIT family hydrolase
MTVDLKINMSNVGMDKGRLLSKVMHLHLHEITVFLDAPAPSCFVI